MQGIIILKVEQTRIDTDKFDCLRKKWEEMLTGSTAYDTKEAAITAKISSIAAKERAFKVKIQKINSIELPDML